MKYRCGPPWLGLFNSIVDSVAKKLYTAKWGGVQPQQKPIPKMEIGGKMGFLGFDTLKISCLVDNLIFKLVHLAEFRFNYKQFNKNGPTN